MIAKSVIDNIISKQWRQSDEIPLGFAREITSSMPYLTDKALILGGVRGAGCSTILLQLLHGEYTKAWYTDFDDPRLVGFDSDDFAKLTMLIIESGRGVLLLDGIDNAVGWQDFIKAMVDRGLKVIAVVSASTLMTLQTEASAEYILRRVELLSLNEYMDATRKKLVEGTLVDYITKGAFASQVKSTVNETLSDVYKSIISRDVIIAGGVRDRTTLQRIALKLMDSCGEPVSANAIRNQLKIKAVSTVAEHFDLLSRVGIFSFVPIYSDRKTQQAVNPRKVYPVDSAMAQAMTTTKILDAGKLLEAVVYRYLRSKYSNISYTLGDGGCDFVVADDEVSFCMQVCYDYEDIDTLSQKRDGIMWAMDTCGIKRGVIVTANSTDQILYDDCQIDVIDGGSLLSENYSI